MIACRDGRLVNEIKDLKYKEGGFFISENFPLLLMAEILHHLIGSLSHYFQGFIHLRWCRIPSINSSSTAFFPIFEFWEFGKLGSANFSTQGDQEDEQNFSLFFLDYFLTSLRGGRDL